MSHEAHSHTCRAACFKHAERLPDFRSSDGACEVEIGGNEMRAIGNMRFRLRVDILTMIRPHSAMRNAQCLSSQVLRNLSEWMQNMQNTNSDPDRNNHDRQPS